MIIQVEQLLTQQGPMTLAAISQALDMPPSALQGMLHLLINKGRIEAISGSSRCGGCTSCEAHQQTSYIVASN